MKPVLVSMASPTLPNILHALFDADPPRFVRSVSKIRRSHRKYYRSHKPLASRSKGFDEQFVPMIPMLSSSLADVLSPPCATILPPPFDSFTSEVEDPITLHPGLEHFDDILPNNSRIPDSFGRSLFSISRFPNNLGTQRPAMVGYDSAVLAQS